jgi:hypothetical protein
MHWVIVAPEYLTVKPVSAAIESGGKYQTLKIAMILNLNWSRKRYLDLKISWSGHSFASKMVLIRRRLISAS